MFGVSLLRQLLYSRCFDAFAYAIASMLCLCTFAWTLLCMNSRGCNSMPGSNRQDSSASSICSVQTLHPSRPAEALRVVACLKV